MRPARPYLAAIPAVLAMAGLACSRQGERPLPEALLLAALLAALASLGLVWHNARRVARRADALSGAAAPAPRAYEPDDLARRLADAEARVGEYAALLSGTAAELGRRLDEVRLPLHILLAAPFGELNENQEEILGAAQSSAEAAHEELRTIARIVELDAGRVESRPRPVRPLDLLAPVLAAAGSRIRSAGGTFGADVPPALPHVQTDPEHAREALSLILNRLAARATADTSVRLTADQPERGTVRLRIHERSIQPDERFSLAERLLRLQGARTVASPGMVEVRFGGLCASGTREETHPTEGGPAWRTQR